MAKTNKANSGKFPVNMEGDSANRFNPPSVKKSNATKPNSGAFPVNMENDSAGRFNPRKRGGK